jgi:hypothetical protein
MWPEFRPFRQVLAHCSLLPPPHSLPLPSPPSPFLPKSGVFGCGFRTRAPASNPGALSAYFLICKTGQSSPCHTKWEEDCQAHSAAAGTVLKKASGKLGRRVRGWGA